MLLAEACVVALLGVAIWHLVEQRQAAAGQPLDSPPAPLAPGSPRPLPDLGGLAPDAARAGRPAGVVPTPGLRRDRPFWTGRLSEVNREQRTWEDAQWRLTQSVIAAARAYIESVVVPAVERAEHGRDPPTASPGAGAR